MYKISDIPLRVLSGRATWVHRYASLLFRFPAQQCPFVSQTLYTVVELSACLVTPPAAAAELATTLAGR